MSGHTPKVVIVGAGMGGLACAIELATKGFAVKVLERLDVSGGKARCVSVGGTDVAAGPTVLTMPWVFDELFERAGASFRGAVALERAEIVARHAWADGTRLDLFGDRRESADSIGRVFGAREARAYLEFCEDGKRIYAVAEEHFLRSQRMTMTDVVKRFGLAGIATIARLDSHRSMWRALEDRFASPRLRQLFGRYATYCGSSPFEAPATLNLVAHVEAEGVYRTRGGARAVVDALLGLALSVGVEIVHGAEVERVLVERGKAVGVVSRGAVHRADAVVFNGDVSALGSGLLSGGSSAFSPTPRAARSLSAVTWAMVARARGFPLVHHNVFFSDDYPAEFDDISRRARVPEAPTVYVCAQDRGDAPVDAEQERLLVIVNAPASGDEPELWNETEKQRCTTTMMTWLRKSGLTLEPHACAQTTPADFDRLFPKTGGALYGPRSTGAFSALSRHGASSRIPRLYLAGGSVHPGAGLPMAALSGRLAAQRVCEDLGSTVRSRAAATTGTTSMR